MSGAIVIVGAGHGGCQVAASLRQEGFEGPITLIGDEPGLPYQRPPLSKAYMKDGDAARLALRPESFFEAGGIARLAGVRVVAIDRAAQSVRTDDGRTIPYDRLVLATGGRNFAPPIAGLQLDGVLSLRTLADAGSIRARLGEARRAVVVGGGFIGLEFASVARGFGLDVTVLEAADRLMARVVSPEISALFLDAHRAAGADVLLGALAGEVLDEGAGRAAGVRLADGRVVDGDLVLIAAGLRPNVDLAEACGLAIDNGVAVDAGLASSDPRIFAIGDCASFPAPGSGHRIRLESVQAATDHARALARTLAGHPTIYDAAPWFWSDQGALKLQIAGLGAGADRRLMRVPGEGKAVVLNFGNGTLLAVETVNAPGDHMAARKLLGSGRAVTEAMLAEAGHDLRSLLKATAA